MIFLHMITTIKWAFVGGPTISPNKSKIADVDHIVFRKMLIIQCI